MSEPENATATDCRGETGITVGLVDSIITAVRLLRDRDLAQPQVVEALRDLVSDPDLVAVLYGRDRHVERLMSERVALIQAVRRNAAQERRLRELDEAVRRRPSIRISDQTALALALPVTVDPLWQGRERRS